MGSTREETLDTLFQGKLAIIQSKGGYRFSLDAVLLAQFVRLLGWERVVDLGAGNGVIPLILATRYPSVEVTGLEIQQEMVSRAVRSIELNQLGDRVEMMQGDVCSIKQIFSREIFDAAVCNPPYRRRSSGRINPDPERRVARHEIKGCLRDFLRAGSYLLRHGGKMALVYPAARMLDLLQAMREEKLEPKRVRLVHSSEDTEATLVLAEGIKGGRSELRIDPPLAVYTRDRKYTREMKAIISFASGSGRKRVFLGPGGFQDP